MLEPEAALSHEATAAATASSPVIMESFVQSPDTASCFAYPASQMAYTFFSGSSRMFSLAMGPTQFSFMKRWPSRSTSRPRWFVYRLRGPGPQYEPIVQFGKLFCHAAPTHRPIFWPWPL